jgi:hypothetical protein
VRLYLLFLGLRKTSILILQKPNRTLLPKSPFFKGGLYQQFLIVPPFIKGGLGGICGYQGSKKLLANAISATSSNKGGQCPPYFLSPGAPDAPCHKNLEL